ncbi:MAG: ethanolamine ammonia-lyase subunit EutB [Anaerolineae bacterium]|nr:ethanolamine ammonia-lyase subunit EutB [Anaerolineae bacterium]
MLLRCKLFGKTYEFRDLREVMGKANEEKSGDHLAGVAASSAIERAAAKYVLSEVPLWALYENPVIPYEQDEVTRVILDAVAQNVYADIRNWTVGELREWLLDNRTTDEDIHRAQQGLTSEMIAAVAKLMSNMDLVLAASKIRVVTHANNTMGLMGTLASRNQPNHPTDDPDGIRAEIYEGLSYGSGDSVIGINPVDDSLASVQRLLDMSYKVIQDWKIPTQNCVLSHVTTQMEAMKRGSPVGLVFQSLAGSQKGNDSFGISVGMLDEAYEIAKKYAVVPGPNYMYFETGEGAELSADAHYGWDQLTLEVRCYGLAKRYAPFQVNSVVGFIGPEYLYDARQITRAGLEDHFCAKLTGISMGCDACYTNHARADQNSLENLSILLAAAGCNYFMGLPMGDDPMLSYQSNSFHDAPSLRQILRLRPLPEFEAWLVELGLWDKDKLQLTDRAGDATLFVR